MKEELPGFSNEERIRAENNILKMKLMLEKGARFQEDAEPLPPEIEHEFLKHVIAFEKQLENHRKIPVFEKIGCPAKFRPVADIPEVEIEAAWMELDDYMRAHGVSLDVCSPNVSAREIYRFCLEELFSVEMEDFDMPGMIYCFIYDEFHPDPVYENSRAALNTISCMLRQGLLECLPHIRRERLRLNKRHPLTDKEFKWYVNQFKNAYEEISEPALEQHSCSVNDKYSVVSGSYSLRVSLQTEHIQLQGQWSVEFEFDEELGYWYVFNVQVEGINF